MRSMEQRTIGSEGDIEDFEFIGTSTTFGRRTAEKIIEAMKLGSSVRLALKYAGASTEVFSRWREKARKGREPYLSFFKELNEMRGERAQKWLRQIEDAAEEGKWQAAAWKLAHCERETFGEMSQVKEGNKTNLQVHIFSSLSDLELKEKERALRETLEKLEGNDSREMEYSLPGKSDYEEE